MLIHLLLKSTNLYDISLHDFCIQQFCSTVSMLNYADTFIGLLWRNEGVYNILYTPSFPIIQSRMLSKLHCLPWKRNNLPRTNSFHVISGLSRSYIFCALCKCTVFLTLKKYVVLETRAKPILLLSKSSFAQNLNV